MLEIGQDSISSAHTQTTYKYTFTKSVPNYESLLASRLQSENKPRNRCLEIVTLGARVNAGVDVTVNHENKNRRVSNNLHYHRVSTTC